MGNDALMLLFQGGLFLLALLTLTVLLIDKISKNSSSAHNLEATIFINFVIISSLVNCHSF